MVGKHLKDNKAIEKLYRWTMSAIADDHRLSHSSHISEFVDFPLSNKEQTQFTIDSYLEVMDWVLQKKMIKTMMPSAYFPLECSETIVDWDSDKPLCDQLIDEPPTLYIINREKRKYKLNIEKYHRPVNLKISKLDSKYHCVYYSCARDIASMQAGEEFGRSIHIEYYPKAFLFD